MMICSINLFSREVEEKITELLSGGITSESTGSSEHCALAARSEVEYGLYKWGEELSPWPRLSDKL